MKFNSDGECLELGIDEIWGLLVNMSEEAAILAQRIRVLETAVVDWILWGEDR